MPWWRAATLCSGHCQGRSALAEATATHGWVGPKCVRCARWQGPLEWALLSHANGRGHCACAVCACRPGRVTAHWHDWRFRAPPAPPRGDAAGGFGDWVVPLSQRRFSCLHRAESVFREERVQNLLAQKLGLSAVAALLLLVEAGMLPLCGAGAKRLEFANLRGRKQLLRLRRLPLSTRFELRLHAAPRPPLAPAQWLTLTNGWRGLA
jgi:hypothetical protein